MLVLAAVSDVQYQRLRGAVMPRFTLARAATWDVALETIKCRPVEIAVVDPMLGGAQGQEVEPHRRPSHPPPGLAVRGSDARGVAPVARAAHDRAGAAAPGAPLGPRRRAPDPG